MFPRYFTWKEVLLVDCTHCSRNHSMEKHVQKVLCGSTIDLMGNLDDHHLQHLTSESNYVPKKRREMVSQQERQKNNLNASFFLSRFPIRNREIDTDNQVTRAEVFHQLFLYLTTLCQLHRLYCIKWQDDCMNWKDTKSGNCQL